MLSATGRGVDGKRGALAPHNTQLQRTVIPHRVPRARRCNCALAARMLGQRAAAELHVLPNERRSNWTDHELGRRSRRSYTRSILPEVHVTAKDTVRELLDRLPNDCSLDDVLYHLYVVQAVGRGLADGEAGRVIPHEQVAADLRRKWLLGSAT